MVILLLVLLLLLLLLSSLLVSFFLVTRSIFCTDCSDKPQHPGRIGGCTDRVFRVVVIVIAFAVVCSCLLWAVSS